MRTTTMTMMMMMMMMMMIDCDVLLLLLTVHSLFNTWRLCHIATTDLNADGEEKEEEEEGGAGAGANNDDDDIESLVVRLKAAIQGIPPYHTHAHAHADVVVCPRYTKH